MNKYTEEQVCNFWHTQLQLFQLSTREVLSMFYVIYGTDMYVKTEYSKKLMYKYLYQSPTLLTEEDKECLATHIALQLAGIDE
jgi:hypothetical protein